MLQHNAFIPNIKLPVPKEGSYLVWKDQSCKRLMRIVLSIIALFASVSVNGQSSNLKFKHLSFTEGLAQSPISSIIKDSKGFIWLGNWKGLTRYDGYTFRNFHHQPENAKSISNNRVNSIIEDKYGKLWIGTSNGLNHYDPSTEVFERIDIKNVKGGRNYVSAVRIDSYGKVWVSTFAGIKLVDTGKKLLLSVPTLKDTSVHNLFTAVTFTLFEDRDKVMWVGSKNGVKRFDPKTKKLLSLPSGITDAKDLMSAKIIVIRQDRDGNMWFGSEASGLYCYDVSSKKVFSFTHNDFNDKGLLSNWVRDIFVYDAEHIWIGTRNGLSVYNKITKKFTNYAHHSSDPDGLNDSTIWSFMMDGAGGIWVGTFAGGLNVYYPQNGNFMNIGEGAGQRIGLSHPMVNAIAQEKDGTLWIGTYGGGINHLNLKTKSYTFFPIRNDKKQTRNGVKSLALGDNGKLWVGTLDGLCSFDQASGQVKFFNFSVSQGKFSENLINVIVPDEGTVWVGTNGGGLRNLKENGSYSTFVNISGNKNTISDNFVTSMLKDARQNLWIGTQNGLNYYDTNKKKFTRYLKSSSPYTLGNNSIITLLKDSKDRLWIGTEGGGLIYYEPIRNRFYSLNASSQITDDVIHSILEDEQGHIWVSTDNGLYKLRFKNFNLPFKAENVTVTNYTADDGLSSNQFLTNSGIKLKDGQLMFGGINGLTSFNPQQIIKNTLKPKVVFTDFLIRNKVVAIDSVGSPLKESVTFAKQIKLSHDEGYFTIKFAALNFINSEKNQYAYKMEGIAGDDWHYSGTQREANYTNLGPGAYNFKVMAANNDGVWNHDAISIHIVILPPWWQTWWAYLIYILIIFFVAKTIYDFLRNRVKLKRELYLEQVANERQEELYQMKIDFFTNISHEIRTPLTLILGPLEKLLLTVDPNNTIAKQLLQVQNNANRLLRLVTELMDFRKAESGFMKLAFSSCNIVHFTEEIFLSFQNLAEDKKINYRFITDQPEIIAYFDKDHLEKVLFNLLSNAFKFTAEGGEIEVIISTDQKSVEISIKDNGSGISPQNIDKLFTKFFQVYNADQANNGYGIGLALSKSIMELHKGSIKVESDISNPNNRSTMFTVNLKLGFAHLDQKMLIPEYMNSDNPVHYHLQSQANDIITPNETAIDVVKHTILVIEDNVEVRNFIHQSFLNQYKIIQAANGVEGLNVALKELPDLIISDVMMPEMDGLELCRRVKTDERINHVPVILLTARAAYIHQINGLEKGADAYITKPFSIQVLGLNIKNILATKEATRQQFIKEILLNPKLPEELSPDEKFIQKLMAIIEQHLDNSELDVSTIVEEIGMSKTVLYKKVQAVTNLSVADFIKSVRLKRAAFLLAQNKITIAEIAFAVGFTDRKYFSKEFKKLYGVSPSEYILIQATNN